MTMRVLVRSSSPKSQSRLACCGALGDIACEWGQPQCPRCFCKWGDDIRLHPARLLADGRDSKSYCYPLISRALLTSGSAASGMRAIAVDEDLTARRVYYFALLKLL